jgi:uncharacterized protein (TIGR03084 family)
MTDLSGLVADLAAEDAALDAMVADLTEEQWATPTPAEGWAVTDCISHLHYFDDKALLALSDPAAFQQHAEDLLGGRIASGSDTAPGRELGGLGLLPEWRRVRDQVLEALGAADPTVRVPWYGPPMSLASFVTARLMETWSHGHDVADALGLPPVVSDRLRSVCHISVGARAYSYVVNGLTDPGTPVRVEVTGPAGQVWTWGPADATDRITGTALHFAQLVTHRRHRDDTDLVVEGDTAEQWMSIAQSFAGPSGTPRAALSRETP